MARFFTEHFESGSHKFQTYTGSVSSGLSPGDGSTYTGFFNANQLGTYSHTSTFTEVYGALWFKFTDIAGEGTTTNKILRINSGSTILLTFRLTGANKLNAHIDTTSVASGITTIVDNTWYNLQFRYVLHASTGIVHTKLNGVDEHNVSGINTTNGASNFETFSLIHGNATQAIHIDGLILQDTTGGAENSFPGIIKVVSVMPTGDSATNDAWSNSTGTDGFALTDERPPNTTDYVYSVTNAQQQGFTFPTHGLPTQVAIVSVIHEYYARKITDGQIKLGVKSGATEALGSAVDLPVSFGLVMDRRTVDPDTTSTWSRAGVDAAESLFESVI